MSSVFIEWVCVFPGKMGISWKLAPPYTTYDSKEAAEQRATQNCNVVAVPLPLFERYKEYERRTIQAERTLQQCQSNQLCLHMIQLPSRSAPTASNHSTPSCVGRFSVSTAELG